MKFETYQHELYKLWLKIVKLQQDVVLQRRSQIIIIEGRDGAGKDGLIKAITKYTNPNVIKVVSLGKPTENDERSWYFKRFVKHFPKEGEIVIFNRSWYSRALVEPVMGFCTEKQYEDFMESVVPFEQLVVKSGIALFKYYLDVSKEEQTSRLSERKHNPLTGWKLSGIDELALDKFDDYTRYQKRMLKHTEHMDGQWLILDADDKYEARLTMIKDWLDV